ncbi:MAG: NUDIX domain-containing protein [Clostridia bacterium]|jgi:ADP-ribose pyrophosphatase YjhB (NUDIX family)|nr:NUDIX domain-containing protein [Clostridia bacterium]
MSYILELRNALKEEYRHMPIIQVGAAIVVAKGNEILLQRRTDNDKWGLPGGVQELKESVRTNAVRELYEETNLITREEDLILFEVFSGSSRYSKYPNGDEVYNNTTVFVVKEYTGELKCDEESKELKFFDVDNLPDGMFEDERIMFDTYIEKLKVGLI